MPDPYQIGDAPEELGGADVAQGTSYWATRAAALVDLPLQEDAGTGPTTWLTASRDFDGTAGDVISTGLTVDLTQAFAFSCWFYDSTDVAQFPLGDAGANENLFQGSVDAATFPGLALILGGYTVGAQRAIWNTALMTASVWHQIGVLWDGIDTATAYIDGVSIGDRTLTAPGASATTVELQFGGRGTGSFFGGRMADIYFEDSAVAAVDLAELYTGKEPKPLTATPTLTNNGDGTLSFDPDAPSWNSYNNGTATFRAQVTKDGIVVANLSTSAATYTHTGPGVYRALVIGTNLGGYDPDSLALTNEVTIAESNASHYLTDFRHDFRTNFLRI